MDNGTNNYNAKKLTPSETIVSRTLQAKYRSFSNVIWRSGKPALDSEWNLINDVSSELVSSLIQSKTPSGWLELGNNVNGPLIANTIQFFAQKNQQQAAVPNAIVNGWPILAGGVNHIDTSINSITLRPATTSARYDFVFLEVWKAQLRSRDANNNPISQNKPDINSIYKFGNVQFGGTNLPDDIVDQAIKPSVNGIETSERVQIQYRIRTVSGINFENTEDSGFDDPTVQGQGANVNPQSAGYSFINMKDDLGDCGLWRAGIGDEASTVALGSVDGYSYAIPMFKIFRRSILNYNDTGTSNQDAYVNQSSNSAVISNIISDRPDNKFNDGIDASDIIDLRNKVSEFNCQEVMEQNLDALFSGRLRSSFVQDLAYDSICNSTSPVYGYNQHTTAQLDGNRTYWSDAITQQSNIFAGVSITTTDTTLNVYRIGSGNWSSGDQIVVKITPNLPIGTTIPTTPRIYLEDPTKTDISSKGTWTTPTTSKSVFTFNNVTGLNNFDIWVYYDILLPGGQGLVEVPDELLRVNYMNASSYNNGTIVRTSGSIAKLEPKVTRFQDLFNHTYNNTDNVTVYTESSIARQSKQVVISPMVQTTSTRDGLSRVLEVETLDSSAKTIYIPYALQHLKGVYTAQTGGTEVAMMHIVSTPVDSVDLVNNQILISMGHFIGSITSLQYDSTGLFNGGQIELLASNGPVFQHHEVTTGILGTTVKLFSTTGQPYVLVDSTVTNYRWTGSKIKVRQSSGYGYDLNGFIIDCSSSDNSGVLGTFVDRTKLWIDCDYLGSPAASADLRVIYKHTPYQGATVGSQQLDLLYKRERGFYSNNGTGGTIASNYSPLSPRLPGIIQDYLINGSPIQVSSCGTKRYDSDLCNAVYDLCDHYLGGCSLWQNIDFQMPPVPTQQRGFQSHPLLEVIFELPLVAQVLADFILPLLVRNKLTGQVYLMIQTGNNGVQKSTNTVSIDLFSLNERILVK